MNSATTPSRRLSASDAFFVAYQEHAGILMQLGIEADLEGKLEQSDLENMIRELLLRWPHLGQTLRKNTLGISWSGPVRANKILRIANGDKPPAGWRNQSIDPFKEPPFQVFWVPNGRSNTVAFQAHHAALDGESFFAVCSNAVRLLARPDDDGLPNGPFATPRLRNLVSRKQLRPRRLASMWRYLRWLNAEARSERSARIAMRACERGDTYSAERILSLENFTKLKQRAAELKSGPLWVCAAAWMRAIHHWNVDHDRASSSFVSLEVPVSLRRSRKRVFDSVGNFISPLVLCADATQPLPALAGDLRQQLMKAMRSASHLGMPLFTAPGRFLPWSLFRRLAINPRTTGFATSHFTWFEHDSDVRAEVARLSEGALRVTAHRIYSPVCLHMGAALAVVAWPDHAQMFLTYRGTALTATDAERLLDLVVDELFTKANQR